MAMLWIVGIAAIFVIIWSHGQNTQSILDAIGGAPPLSPPTPQPTLTQAAWSNNPMPIAGNEHGFLDVYGSVSSGDVQPSGPDSGFGDVWSSLSGITMQ